MATKIQKKETRKKVKKLRYTEYYGQQPLLDGLYAASTEGEVFDNLMPLITSQENIMQAYRSIKGNTGSCTPGTDGLTIKDIETLKPEALCAEVRRRLTNYRPRAVRRKEIPKPNGKARPLGIPCIFDRLIQQCILQILEPICEARFSDNSYGFRPLRSAENAIAEEMRLINLSKLHFVVEVDIKSFFDEVNHTKLMRQLWAMGIRDKKLLSVIKAILKAPIRMPNGSTVHPNKGTPQGGILSPLLANVVLNELDHWIDSQWKDNPVTEKYSQGTNQNGSAIKSNGYRAMKKSRLKEMHIIRYADDVRILCRTRSQANRTATATMLWLQDRLKLQVSEEKTRVVNVKKSNTEFLGFKLKVIPKAGKNVVKSHICDKAMMSIKAKAKAQIKAIQHPANADERVVEICKYNAMVRGWHNYYNIATKVSGDFAKIAWEVNHALKARLGKQMKKEGKIGKRSQDYEKYGKSQQIRFINGQWILPLAYVQHLDSKSKKREANIYTAEGRKAIHKELRIPNKRIMDFMSKNPIRGCSVEYNDNRVSMFAAQQGKCAITGRPFSAPDEVHCHHRKPRKMGGGDEYENLVLVSRDAHILIHATNEATIQSYLKKLNLNSEQKEKINKLRQIAGCEPA